MEEYTPETILQTIQTIKDEVAPHRMYLVNNEDSPLHKYYVGLDERLKKIYITATIQQDNLDQGTETAPWLNGSCYCVDGDELAYLIGKQLGGDGHSRNMFPLNQQLDRSLWKADEDKVYEHVALGNDREALLDYAIEYKKGISGERRRAYKIYYSFQLIQNNKPLGQPITRVFVNESPNYGKEGYDYNPYAPRPFP